MDLFTYLMAKNGNNTSVHGDLFSYLLGKGQSQTYTVSGITINIPDAKKLVSFMMTKESTQETTTGKNLFNKETAIQGKMINKNTGNLDNEPSTTCSDFIYVNGLTNVILSGTSISYANGGAFYDENKTYISGFNSTTIKSGITIPNNAVYVRFNLLPANINTTQLEKGTTATAYEEYTGGIPSPNPDYPQEVKTVKGSVDVKVVGKNLLDENEIKTEQYNYCTYVNKVLTTSSISSYRTFYVLIPNFDLKTGDEYYVTFDIKRDSGSAASMLNYGGKLSNTNVSKITSTTLYQTYNLSNQYQRVCYKQTATSDYVATKLYFQASSTASSEVYSITNIVISKTPMDSYEAYKEKDVPIPLNNNEIVGIGNYKDELLVDKSGHVFINKKTGKVALDSNANWSLGANLADVSRFSRSLGNVTNSPQLSSHFKYLNSFSSNTEHFYIYNNVLYLFVNNSIATTLNDFKTWIQTQYNNGNPVIVYYVLETPELIDLQTTVDLKLFKGVNNVSNSVDGYMTIEYR